MPSGYEVAGGADLDGVFAPFHSGWPQAAATGYGTAAADLNARYAPLSTGGAAAATGYKKVSADLNTIFAASGSTAVQVGTQPANVAGSAAAGNPSGVVTSGAATCAGAKGGGTYTYTWHTTGCTATSPSNQSTTFFATVNAASTDNATAFCTISDGVTSINTSTISVTLQNTSSAFVPVTHTYTSGTAATEIIPAGAHFCQIKCVGPGGSGGTFLGVDTGGGGGGGGDAETAAFAVTGLNTFLYTVGQGGPPSSGANASNGNPGTTASTVSSGTQAVATMTASPGTAGLGANTGHGAGGAATGGTTSNTAGQNGVNGNVGGAPGNSGAGNAGNPGGGSFGVQTGPSAPGSNGQIQFIYT